MTNLPTMQAPIYKRPLLLYLAISSYDIGALITKRIKAALSNQFTTLVML